MKILQDTLQEIERITNKDYEDILFSNNAESEYVIICSEKQLEEMLDDLIGRIQELEHLLEREKQAHKDTEEYFEENWNPKNPITQYNLNEKDFH